MYNDLSIIAGTCSMKKSLGKKDRAAVVIIATDG